MSHMAVAVITKEYPTEEVLIKTLQPYHEFECDGEDDEYVLTIDKTEEYKKEYDEYKTTYYRNTITNELHYRYDDIFYRPVTEEERELAKNNWVEAREKGIGHRNGDYVVYDVPTHFVEEDVYIKSSKSFKEWVIDYHYDKNNELQKDEEPDLTYLHQFGWYRVDENGEILETVRRTNPNYKWDWWVEGGRYPNLLYDKSKQEWGNVVQKRDLGIEDMTKEIAKEFKQYEDDLKSINSKYTAQKAHPLFVFAYIKDGEWHEQGKMGWWGIVTDETDNDRWHEEVTKMLNELDDDDYITIVDCHI